MQYAGIRLAERTTTAIPGEVIDRYGYAIDPAIPTAVVVRPTPVRTPATKPIPVPEPVTVLLFGAGLAGIRVAVRQRGWR